MLFPETGNWRQGMQHVSAAIDETFGEVVTVTPMRPSKPNFPGEPEPEKAVTVVAVFTSPAREIVMGTADGVTPVVISTSQPCFSFGKDVLPFPLRQGYRVRTCRLGEEFEVNDVRSDGVARIVCPVTQLGKQSERR